MFLFYVLFRTHFDSKESDFSWILSPHFWIFLILILKLFLYVLCNFLIFKNTFWNRLQFLLWACLWYAFLTCLVFFFFFLLNDNFGWNLTLILLCFLFLCEINSPKLIEGGLIEENVFYLTDFSFLLFLCCVQK